MKNGPTKTGQMRLAKCYVTPFANAMKSVMKAIGESIAFEIFHAQEHKTGAYSTMHALGSSIFCNIFLHYNR